MPLNEGIVVRAHGGHYYVHSGQAEVDCTLRGRLKQGRRPSDLIAVGDRVRWRPTVAGCGIIEEILPRQRVLSRCPPPPRPPVEQVILANPDQVVVVFSLHNPPLSPFMLDRYLVACEAAHLPVLLVFNKADLLEEDDQELIALYRGIGYTVLTTSALNGEGLEALRQALRGKVSVLVGPSGVGKSSLLNALWPELNLEVGEISTYHDRGRHTTVVACLLHPEPGTYVADTPGLRQFRLWDIAPEELQAFFPEMAPHLGRCRFKPCTHIHEPGCAVRAAVERGEISELRYESYGKMFTYGF